jgi:predicted dehydrogenase
VVAAGAAATFMVVPRHCVAQSGQTPPSEKINLAAIGVGGQGAGDLGELTRDEGVRVAALCDADERRAVKTFEKFPDAKRYRDFRVMLSEVSERIDAVLVATPDHTHAVAVMAALKRKKHVYCEKPLAHSIWEIREVVKAAREANVVTQLGNQGHSSESIRVFCEWIWDGAIGSVHTIHAGCDANHCKIRQLGRRGEKHEVPKELDWDLWLGPAPFRPYHPMYLPGAWRGWMPFGTGTIGDWTCHVIDPSFWALELGSPESVKVEAKDYDPQKHADTFPSGSVMTFKFAARKGRGPVTLVWHDGVEKIPRPEGLRPDQKLGTGAVILGDKGGIVHGSHGAGGVRLFPEEKMKAYKRPPKVLPRTRGHAADFLRAIRKGEKAGSDFSYGGPLTELAMLGVIGTKLLGQELRWDGTAGRFANSDAANKLLKPEFREGWVL